MLALEKLHVQCAGTLVKILYSSLKIVGVKLIKYMYLQFLHYFRTLRYARKDC